MKWFLRLGAYDTMSHMPMSRASMQALRSIKIEEDRINKLNHIISEIYTKTIGTAEQTNDTRFIHKLPEYSVDMNINPFYNYDFYKNNIAEIIYNLQMLFPDCSVGHTNITMAITHDGNMYDISKMDDNLKSFIRYIQPSKEYIIIDWS